MKVICLTAAVILFLFHRVNTMTERFFSVPLEVSTPPGLAIASAYPKTVRITLRGSEDAIYPDPGRGHRGEREPGEPQEPGGVPRAM